MPGVFPSPELVFRRRRSVEVRKGRRRARLVIPYQGFWSTVFCGDLKALTSMKKPSPRRTTGFWTDRLLPFPRAGNRKPHPAIAREGRPSRDAIAPIRRDFRCAAPASPDPRDGVGFPPVAVTLRPAPLGRLIAGEEPGPRPRRPVADGAGR
jgi:hypothetical protein